MSLEQQGERELHCKRCGLALVQKSRDLVELRKKINFFFTVSALVYRVVYVCPKRMQVFGWMWPTHDQIEVEEV